MINTTIKAIGILKKRDKKFLLILVLFSIFISIVELIGVSAIMPFMSISLDTTLIHSNEYYKSVYIFFNFSSEADFVIIFGIVLVFFYLCRSIVNIFYSYLMAKFSQGRYHLISFRLFENFMGMPYKSFVKKNTSTLTKSIVSEASQASILFSALLLMISEILVALLIYITMIYVNYKITIIVTLFLVINAIFIIKTISKRIKRYGHIRANKQKIFFEVINKNLSNFKLIKLQANSKDIINEFEDISSSLAKANIYANTLLQVPRFILEAVAFSLVISIVLYLTWSSGNNVAEHIGVLSMFLLGLYRLMPSINRLMTSYNQILFAQKALDLIHVDLNSNVENIGNSNISFKSQIILKDISFKYEKDKIVLNSIDIKINKGSKIAFVGESGSGKSTLVDIIIGLYQPSSGIIKVDGIELNSSNIKNWRSKVGYIPQSIYLFDGTVAENVSHGSQYDEKRVIEVLKKSEIYDFFQKKEGIHTPVGEGGIMLSGGQKQRIAIARALYNSPEILVLDEATSALDSDTEAKIMNEIYRISKDKTLIIIAHRLSTIEKCDITYKIVNKRLVKHYI